MPGLFLDGVAVAPQLDRQVFTGESTLAADARRNRSPTCLH
jgi:hypothetical protein